MSAALTEGMEPDIDTVLVLNEVGQQIPMKLIVPLYSKSAVSAAVLAERERCAKVCEELNKRYAIPFMALKECAAAIRGAKS